MLVAVAFVIIDFLKKMEAPAYWPVALLKVEVSDTTGDDNSNAAGNQINIRNYLSLGISLQNLFQKFSL